MPRFDVFLASAVSNGVPLMHHVFRSGPGRTPAGSIEAPAGSRLEAGRGGAVLAVPTDGWGTIVRLSAADACEQARERGLGLVWEPAGTGGGLANREPARRPETGRPGDGAGAVEGKAGVGS